MQFRRVLEEEAEHSCTMVRHREGIHTSPNRMVQLDFPSPDRRSLFRGYKVDGEALISSLQTQAERTGGFT